MLPAISRHEGDLMEHRLRLRFWLESAVALGSAFLFVLTLVWPDWIEGVFGTDPDHGSGALEWAIVAAALAFAVAFSRVAWVERRRAAHAA
jgi:hypothetical protein